MALDIPTIGGVDFLLQFALLGNEIIHLIVGHFLGELGADLFEPLQQCVDLTNPVHDVRKHVFGGIEFRFLFQVADPDALRGPGLTREFGLNAGHDFQHGGLSGTVVAEHTDFGAGQERQRNVFHHFPAAGIGLAQLIHGVDVLVTGHGQSGPFQKVMTLRGRPE